MGGRADAIIGLITESRTYYIMTDVKALFPQRRNGRC